MLLAPISLMSGLIRNTDGILSVLVEIHPFWRLWCMKSPPVARPRFATSRDPLGGRHISCIEC
jgi:hypothetical protein